MASKMAAKKGYLLIHIRSSLQNIFIAVKEKVLTDYISTWMGLSFDIKVKPTQGQGQGHQMSNT